MAFEFVPLQAVGVTGSYAFATPAITGASATVGMPESVTYISIPEVHIHDQPRRQPLEGIEAFSTAPFVLCVGGYLVVRRGAYFVRKLGE